MRPYTGEQLENIFGATPPGWPTTAVKILLGTGMRLSELCGLIIEDFEDDGESAFLKVREKHGRSSWQLNPSSRRRFPAGAGREFLDHTGRCEGRAADASLSLQLQRGASWRGS